MQKQCWCGGLNEHTFVVMRLGLPIDGSAMLQGSCMSGQKFADEH